MLAEVVKSGPGGLIVQGDVSTVAGIGAFFEGVDAALEKEGMPAAFDLGADVNAALNILAAGLAVSARGGSGITPAREPRTQPRDRPLHAGSTGIPVKMTFVI